MVASEPESGAVDKPSSARFRERVSTLRDRGDFLRAARAQRKVRPGFVLQARSRAASEHSPSPVRVGYTCSKKVGNAVMRNRSKRRLRAVAREVFGTTGQDGWDYVLIGRSGQTANRRFSQMIEDLRSSLREVHGG